MEINVKSSRPAAKTITKINFGDIFAFDMSWKSSIEGRRYYMVALILVDRASNDDCDHYGALLTRIGGDGFWNGFFNSLDELAESLCDCSFIKGETYFPVKDTKLEISLNKK